MEAMARTGTRGVARGAERRGERRAANREGGNEVAVAEGAARCGLLEKTCAPPSVEERRRHRQRGQRENTGGDAEARVTQRARNQESRYTGRGECEGTDCDQ